MNINDFEAPDAPNDRREIFAAIWQRQRDLMIKYKEIEKLPDPPVSLHHANGQRIIRDFAWRYTEELTESYEAYVASYPPTEMMAKTHREHCHEELADALHFLVELMIFAGISAIVPGELTSSLAGSEEHAYWNCVYRLGVAINFLRNKAWKKSHVPTDEVRFRAAVLEAFTAHLELWDQLGLSEIDIYNYYFRKSEVNKFRQRSNY